MKKIQNFLFYLFCFSINFESWDPFGIGDEFLITKVTSILYILSTFTDTKFFFSYKEQKKYLFPLWLFFLLLTYMNYRNVNSAYPVILDVSLLLNILLMQIMINHSRRDPDVLFKGLIAFALSIVCITVMFSLDIGTTYSLRGRLTIFNQNPNGVAIRISVAIILFLAAFMQKDRNIVARWLYLIPIPLMFAFIIQTGSRTAIAVLFLSIVMYNLIAGRISVKKVVQILSVFAVLIVVWILFISNYPIAERIVSTLVEGDLSGREVRWLSAINIISQNYLFGVGQTGYGNLIESYLRFYSSPHNLFIELLCYVGIVGLCLFALLLYHLIRSVVHSLRWKNDFLPLILFIPILGMMLVGQILLTKFVWLIFAYILSFNFKYDCHHYTPVEQIST